MLHFLMNLNNCNLIKDNIIIRRLLMDRLINDIQILLEKIKISQGTDDYISYVSRRKNIFLAQNINIIQLEKKRSELLLQQEIVDEKVYNEIELLDSLNIQFLGFKGLFLKKDYYDDYPRFYKDIDILVRSDDAKLFYEGLKKLGYQIKLKTMYDNPLLNMRIFPKIYMDNTQTLMLINKDKNISIDLHCNLNITNAHFINSATNFQTDELMEHSQKFDNFENARTFEIHDNLCFLFRHLLKHHVFYGKTQAGLKTPLQHIFDIAVIINTELFDEKVLFDRVVKYNIIPEALFCLNLYNNIFKSGKYIEITQYLQKLDNANQHIKWKPILLASLEMPIENLMIGNFNKYFPKLQYAIDCCELLPSYKFNWFIQSFFISFFVDKLL